MDRNGKAKGAKRGRGRRHQDRVERRRRAEHLREVNERAQAGHVARIRGAAAVAPQLQPLRRSERIRDIAERAF